MTEVTLDRVFRTYNGKSGCACGCNGRYSLLRHEDIALANERAGWEANTADDVRPLAVKRCVGAINKAIAAYLPLAKRRADGAFEYNGPDAWFFMGDEFVAVDANGRANTVYFRR